MSTIRNVTQTKNTQKNPLIKNDTAKNRFMMKDKIMNKNNIRDSTIRDINQTIIVGIKVQGDVDPNTHAPNRGSMIPDLLQPYPSVVSHTMVALDRSPGTNAAVARDRHIPQPRREPQEATSASSASRLIITQQNVRALARTAVKQAIKMQNVLTGLRMEASNEPQLLATVPKLKFLMFRETLPPRSLSNPSQSNPSVLSAPKQVTPVRNAQALVAIAIRPDISIANAHLSLLLQPLNRNNNRGCPS
jgi:hypothetical protein